MTIVEPAPPKADAAPTETETAGAPRRTVAIRLSTLLLALGVIVGVVSVGTSTLAWLSTRDDLHALQSQAVDDAHAEQVATDYAVGAATVNYQDMNAWMSKLKSNTSPELATKFDATVAKLQEILTVLKWTSTATPIAAKVESRSGGVYKADVFVDVKSASSQSADGARTTVTYTVTIDSGRDWKVVDVGGMDGALPLK
ncbi:hypothetical protein [Nocardia jejuensis]|uniref:hypothetical protein n=1 Tax=Nocardia jejuensis TaxID=328049 RepID=UPI0008318165|nr:hypothetical protein [Nocardia jejuensis]